MGYQEIQIQHGLNLVALNFDVLGDQPQDIQTFLKGDFTAGDEIMFWSETDSVYGERYTYRDQTYVNGVPNGPGWADKMYAPATREIKPGEAFWISRAGEAMTVVVAGSVTLSDQVITCDSALSLKGLTFPVDVRINDDIITENAVAGDEIMMYSNAENAYVRYVYRDMTYNGSTPAGPAWADKFYQRVNDTIPSGTGFWVASQTPGLTMTVKAPAVNE